MDAILNWNVYRFAGHMTAIHIKTWNVILVFNLTSNSSYLFCVGTFFHNEGMMIWNLPPGIIAVDVIHEAVNVKAEKKKLYWNTVASCQLPVVAFVSTWVISENKLYETTSKKICFYLFSWLSANHKREFFFHRLLKRRACVFLGHMWAPVEFGSCICDEMRNKHCRSKKFIA